MQHPLTTPEIAAPSAQPAPLTDLPDIRADLAQRVVVGTGHMDWETSPSGTLWRKPRSGQGGEFGPVTSLVRSVPGGAVAEHSHPEGEELLVLPGVFSDEHGDDPQSTWLRSPHLSQQQSFSETGCLIKVRVGGLNLMSADQSALRA